MQYTKKISVILFILFIFTFVCVAGPIQKRTIQSYTFQYYTGFLNSVLKPEIEEYISSADLIPLDKQKGNKLIRGIIEIIQLHIQANNILLPPGHKYPVSLVVIPPNKNGFVVYYVNVALPLLEYDKIGNVTSILVISKNFFCGMESIAVKEKA